MRRKQKKKPDTVGELAAVISRQIFGDVLSNFKNRYRDAYANENFYPAFSDVMKERTRLHVRRLRIIETKKANPTILEDLDFMLFTNQNDLDEVLARIGNYYLTNIL
jgi:hypothetical protein